ncbi:hypothetical protein BJF89_16925 [Corynebacterium sp. CNJ-954]|nr:hypothetical protein BJF89_16925 [Corynebacterium sp. CNJ-954]
MLVPVSVVSGVTMPVVDVVDVIAMGDGDVPTARSVLVLVVFVDDVLRGLALVPVAVVLAVQVALVGVVDVVAVGDGDVAAVGAVLVVVVLVRLVGHDLLLRSSGLAWGPCCYVLNTTRFQ